MKDFLFVDLAGYQTGSKPFDGLATGTFIDMRGQRAVFKPDELTAYLENTLAAIDSTIGSDGQPVGLPIDQRGHDHNTDAAGWIVNAEIDPTREKIILYPRWTATGINLIGNDLQRFFSPTVDINNKVIMGGSLTNWPATRTSRSEILLRPVELSSGNSSDILSFADGSIDEFLSKVKGMFWERFYDFDAWPVEVFDSYLICYYDGGYWKVPYTAAEDTITFADIQEWIKVKLQYVEAIMGMLKALQWVKGLFGSGDRYPQTVTNSDAPEDIPGEYSKGVAEMPAPNESAIVLPPGLPVELTQEQVDQLQKVINDQVALQVKATLEVEERKVRISKFTQEMIGKGLPVQDADLQTFLSSLDPEAEKQAMSLFSRIVNQGMIDFSETGHSQKVKGASELPPEMKGYLSAWISAGGTVTDFFKANAPELGSESDYNLSEFEKAKE